MEGFNVLMMQLSGLALVAVVVVCVMENVKDRKGADESRSAPRRGATRSKAGQRDRSR